ncbi:MAG: NPCBM/NEW2 domain-containing protein, partial [Verrucomicrobiia bacterium]
NWQGKPLTVADRKFEFGFWVHANSELTFALDGKYERFEAFVGEDKARLGGKLRFKVLSTPPPLPVCWVDIVRDFPLQAGWLRADAGADGIGGWFGKRETGALEQEILTIALKDTPQDSPLQAELNALVVAKASAGDTRWLELYGRICRHRDCAAMLKSLDSADLKAAFEKELAVLVATKAPAEDARWNELRARATQAAELDHQFATLEFDIKQRVVLSKATGERAWNGTRYVPTERSTADEIAKQTFNSASLVLDSDRDPADVVARRTAVLLADLKKTEAAPKLATFDAPLAKLQKAATDTPVTDIAVRRALHHEICKLRRQIAFANPLLNFKDLVFIKRHRTFYQHMCDQFYGICQNPGGGLYVLENAFSEKPAVHDVLASSVCETGRLKGEKLSGGSVLKPDLRYDGQKTFTGEDAEGGSFLSPALSPDGKQIAFAYVERKGGKDQIFHEDPARGHWDAQRSYHVFKVNVDGTRLQQLTDGTWNEFDPCWLPNGRMAFISERRGGYLRCGRACPLYTLYDMNPDGSGINCLSFHDSNEWNPSVSHDGRIVWTRWDYVDRHGCIAHMPWVVTLDGRDPRPLHGNYAPRQARPDMELYVRPIPGSTKYVGLAAPHHGQAYGSMIIINPQVVDDDAMGPVRRFTPEVGFPESQGGRQAYSTPWPLSENYHLCVYDAAATGAPIRRAGENYGIYLVDAFGNKELIYRDPDIGCMNPIPLRATPQPAAPASILASTQATAPANIRDKGEATMAVVNVYDNQKGWAEGTKIKSLRVFQLLPCAVPSGGMRPHETGKRIAEAGDSIVPCRWVLGTVPVEDDGSAHFKVPAYRELFFQALDERGMAITSMRSATSLRDGEKLVCGGCHEHKSQATKVPAAIPLALRRAPSMPTPDVDGSHPFSYPRLVQPVLDRNCVKCHEENKAKKAPALTAEPVANKFYASYNNLVKFGFTAYGDAYRTLNGKFGARASKLIEMLEKGHHDVKLSQEDFHRLTLWIDCCSMFYGVFEKEPGEAQLRGEIAQAILE